MYYNFCRKLKPLSILLNRFIKYSNYELLRKSAINFFFTVFGNLKKNILSTIFKTPQLKFITYAQKADFVFLNVKA